MRSAIERLSDFEITAVKALLTDQGLPADDCDQPANQFYGIHERGRLIACGGLQAAGSSAVLRSVVVIEGYQGEGLGRQIVEYLLYQASLSGVSVIYLLTETATEYFKMLGFQLVERDAVPAEVAATEQFKTLCPASADCLMKTLENSDPDDNSAADT